MKTIKVTVRDKIALASAVEYVCGNSDFVVEFDFDAEWDAHDIKTARFVYNGTYTDVVFSGNQCPVPVISNTAAVKIGVFAGNLQTTTPAYVDAKKSILCENGAPADPPADVYNQIIDLANETKAIAQSVRDDADAGKFDGEDGNNNLFIAKCFETTWEELKAAHDAGKAMFAVFDNDIYLPLWRADDSCFSFNATTTAINLQLNCRRYGGWEKEHTILPVPEPSAVFVARYGETLYEDIDLAYQAGKVLFLWHDGMILPFLYKEGSSFVFATNNTTKYYNRWLTANGNWGNRTIAMPTDARVTAIENDIASIKAYLGI